MRENHYYHSCAEGMAQAFKDEGQGHRRKRFIRMMNEGIEGLSKKRGAGHTAPFFRLREGALARI